MLQSVNNALLPSKRFIQRLRLILRRPALVNPLPKCQNGLRGNDRADADPESSSAAKDKCKLRDVVADCADSLVKVPSNREKVVNGESRLLDRQRPAVKPRAADVADTAKVGCEPGDINASRSRRRGAERLNHSLYFFPGSAQPYRSILCGLRYALPYLLKGSHKRIRRWA